MDKDKIITFLCSPVSSFPNNAKLEVCILKEVLSSSNDDLAYLFERHFEENGWPSAWKNGLYDVHHFHSTAHEALGVYSGWVKVCFGGPNGHVERASIGDVIIIPAGVSHMNVGQSADFRVVGAYPIGQQWNMKYGKPRELSTVRREISQVISPSSDPFFGPQGPLMEIWAD